MINSLPRRLFAAKASWPTLITDSQDTKHGGFCGRYRHISQYAGKISNAPASLQRKSRSPKFLIFGVDKSLVMRTLNIAISELEYEKFGLTSNELSFSEFVEIISRELSRQNLKKAVELSERYGLSNLSMDEISAEVKAVRNNAAHP